MGSNFQTTISRVVVDRSSSLNIFLWSMAQQLSNDTQLTWVGGPIRYFENFPYIFVVLFNHKIFCAPRGELPFSVIWHGQHRAITSSLSADHHQIFTSHVHHTNQSLFRLMVVSLSKWSFHHRFP